MAKRGARSTERGRERTSSAPARPSLAPLTRTVPLSTGSSGSAEARADDTVEGATQPRLQRNPIAQPAELARDERESKLFDEFFSWPPPPVDFTPPPFEAPRMTREARRAMWATLFMLSVGFVGFGSFIAYQTFVMPPPAALSEAEAAQTFELPQPILADELAPEPARTDLRAHLATPADLAREAQETAAALLADDQPDNADSPPAAAAGALPLAAAKPAPAQDNAEPVAATALASAAAAAAPSQLAAAKPAASPNNLGPAAAASEPEPSPPSAAAAPVQPPAAKPTTQLAAANSRVATYAPPQPPQKLAPTGSPSASLVPPAPSAPAAAASAPSDDNASFDDLVADARKLFAQGEAKRALLAYDRALRPRPHAIEALLGKAAALFALKDYDAARSTAQEAVALEPSNRDGLMLIGSTWEQLGNKAAAKDTYQRCVDQASESHSAPCRQRLSQLDAKP